MNFDEEYEKRKAEFEEYLQQFTHQLLTFPEQLYSAVTYSLLNGGKRLRPILLLETVRMFGGKVDAVAVNLALAIECIHTYSLIHDDLPCMDNDDIRRGLPTCHKKFGEANAVLAGDTLLNLAYELALSAVKLGNNSEKTVNASICIAAAAGGNGLVGGQICDLAEDVSEKAIDYIYKNKTGALIRAALKAGALIANANEEELSKITDFGELFGYCFQLQDDLLDKDTEEEDKKTYLSLYGEEQTRETLKEKSVAALTILQTMENSEFLAELTTNFMERKE